MNLLLAMMESKKASRSEAFLLRQLMVVYFGITFVAQGPFLPWPTSYSTTCPSLNVEYPDDLISEW
jgi:hypothetical protein